MSSTSKPAPKLRNISSMRELKRERARLQAEQEFAIKAIGDNFSIEKAAIKHKVGKAKQRFQGAPSGLSEAGSIFEGLKWPLLAGFAAIFSFLLTSWLTGRSTEAEETSSRPEENQHKESQSQEKKATTSSTVPREEDVPSEETNRQANDRERSLEERIKAALAEYDQEKHQEENTTADPSAFTTVLRVIGPIFLKEILRGSFEDLNLFGKGSKDQSQEMSDSIADELESMKEELVKEGS